jgi:hypothetical protein
MTEKSEVEEIMAVLDYAVSEAKKEFDEDTVEDAVTRWKNQ